MSTTLEIIPIRAWTDNYFWLIRKELTCVVVDPGLAQPVMDYIADHGLTLSAILVTHHHADHTGGIDELTHHFKDLPVFGPLSDRIPQINRVVGDQETFELLGQTIRVMATPGHTLDHVVYTMDITEDKQALFCGDTLFSGGCGRVFEGTYAQMFQSLARLSQLPDTTLVYPAHEYTLSNLLWAQQVEPANVSLIEYLERLQQQPEPRCSLPSTMKLERQINPFLRCSETSIIKAVEQYTGTKLTDPAMVFKVLREWKNHS